VRPSIPVCREWFRGGRGTSREMSDEQPRALPDVVKLLRQHHELITSILAEVADSTGSRRTATFARLRRVLSVHEALEQVVRPPAA